MTMSEPTTLRTVLATSPLSAPLKNGTLTSARVTLDFVEVSPVHKAFAPMVRQQSFDLCEMAIVTALQAIDHGRPVVLLPAVVASRFQRGCLITRRGHGVPTPQDLPGKYIGVRAYTQTTGMWVRAHLTEDYGLASDRMHWLTHDPAHVEQYRDPAFVEQAVDDKSLVDLLREGVIDAAIFGNDMPKDEDFVPLIADADARDRAWYDQHGFMPINHMLVAGTTAYERDPDAVREAYRLLLQSNGQLPVSTDKPSPYAFGFDALRTPVAYVIDACLEQKLLSRRLSIDEVFGPAEKLLGGLSE
jgi:4,5-dihydroxyphthalate decarboxylase